MSTHELTFGALDLASDLPNEVNGYWFEVEADGFAPGSPEAVKAVIATLMRDGDDERIARYGNRTFTMRIAVRAPDSESLHRGEAALVAELGGRNTITWMPPDGYGGLTVYDVLNSTMSPEFDDRGLLRKPLVMVYSITATCEPWPRSATLTTATGTITGGRGLLSVPVGGSVPTVGSVTVSTLAADGVRIVYADPALVSTTFRPNNPATWQYAPAGRYVLYANWSGVIPANSVLIGQLTIGGATVQEARTRVSGSVGTWTGIGEFTLGGNRDGLVGANSFAAYYNNPSAVNAAHLRLFRIADDTSLIMVNGSADAQEWTLDVPSIDYPQGGLWYADGSDALADVLSYEFPVLAPSTTAVWAEVNPGLTNSITVTLDHYARWHTFAAAS